MAKIKHHTTVIFETRMCRRCWQTLILLASAILAQTQVPTTKSDRHQRKILPLISEVMVYNLILNNSGVMGRLKFRTTTTKQNEQF